MRFVLFCRSILVGTTVSLSAASAATVGASGSVSAYWQANYAYDENGEYVDWNDFIKISGQNLLTTSSGVSAPNGVFSDPTRTAAYTITNTSTGSFVDWFAELFVTTSAGAFADPDIPGNIYYDANTYVTVGNLSGFASVTGDYTCSVLDTNSPFYNCFGYTEGRDYQDQIYEYGLLGPGQSVTFTLTAQSFATQRTTPLVSSVPLPASARHLLPLPPV